MKCEHANSERFTLIRVFGLLSKRFHSQPNSPSVGKVIDDIIDYET